MRSPAVAMYPKTTPLPAYLLASSLFVLLCLLCAAPAWARVYLDITSPDFRKVKMAVPHFHDTALPGSAPEQGRQMADLLSRALAFHGFVAIIDPASYGGRQDADWQKLGSEFTVLGQYEVSGSAVTLELRLHDIQTSRMVLGKRYRGTMGNHREMLKKFCDEVVLQLTGESGVSLSRIAFVSDASGHKEIYLADVLGEDVRQVTRHDYIAISPRFSPDNRWLAYTSYHGGNPNLYITELATLQTTRAISRRPGLNMAPSWAPDSRSMAVTLSKDGNPDLYVIDNSGQELRRLTHGQGINVSPSFSPDGNRLAFVSDRSGRPQVYVMDAKTGTTNRISFLGNENTTPSWSPKGDWIAYTGLVGGSRHILLIRPEGGTPVQLTQGGGEHESPSWSPDGRQVVFSRKQGNKQELYTVFRNGTGQRPLFKLKGSHSSPQWSPRQNM